MPATASTTATPDIAVRTGRVPAGWDAYVERHPAATAYHGSVWPQTVAQVFRLQSYYLTASDPSGAGLRGVLPLVRQKSLLFGDRLTSLPFFNYGGALADDPATATGLLERAADLGRELGVDQLEIRSVEPPSVSWPLRTDKATLLLELPDSVEALSRQLGSKLRSQVKRAQREAPSVHVGGLDQLPDFYRVFSEVMRDLGTPVYPKRFFAALLEHCGAQSTVVVLRLNGAPVAAAYLVGHRDRLEIPWAATVSAVKSKSINMALYWEVLRHAVERGYRCFDFGRSTVDSGPYRFKLQWGARPVALQWAVWSSVTTPVEHDGRTRALATRAWAQLPLPIANRLGPLVSPTLPW